MNDKQPIEPVAPQDYLLVRLAMVSDGKRSARQLAADLKSRLSPAHTTAALDALAAQGLVKTDGKVSLTDAGTRAVRERFGDLRRDRKRLETRVEPALALGLPPESDAAVRLARPDTLRAVLLTRLYRLPRDEAMVTMAQAAGTLLRRGVAGLLPPKVDAALATAARDLPGDLADTARLRGALIKLALSLGAAAADSAAADTAPVDTAPVAEAPAADVPETPAPAPAASATTDDLTAFAARVLDITRTAHAGPFSHKTPIAHVYDTYGRRHGDAGSLDSFKHRLLRASNAGHLALLPLDDSTTMDATTRERSEIPTPTGRLHFIERDQ